MFSTSQKINRVKIYRNGQNLYQIIFGGPVQLEKGTKNCCVRNSLTFYFMFKTYTNGEPVNSFKNVSIAA